MADDLLEDPFLRQRYRFSREGDVLRLSLWADPGARVPYHFHPPIEERFEVREGEFTFKVDGRELRAGPGDKLVAEAGVRHSFENTGPGVSHFVAEIEPALDMQSFFEESAALSQAGMFRAPGIPKGLRGLLAATEFADRYHEIFVAAFPPPALQRISSPPLARIERWRRRRANRRRRRSRPS